MFKVFKNDSYIWSISSSTFPDGTPLMKSMANTLTNSKVNIYWKYRDDSELFRLMCCVRDLQSKGVSDIELTMPYIPNARMDRVHTDNDVFTLKYFAEFINSLGFKRVTVLDAHSNVALGLINSCYNISPAKIIKDVLEKLNFDANKGDIIVYIDAGCKKRLENEIDFPSVFCDKKRDWESGKITKVDVYGYTEIGETSEGYMLTNLDGARVLLIDDICSYGSTAEHTLKALKGYGVKECYCYFTHVEKSIFGDEVSGKVPRLLLSGLIDGVYCTDSLISTEYIKNFGDSYKIPFSVYNAELFTLTGNINSIEYDFKRLGGTK